MKFNKNFQIAILIMLLSMQFLPINTIAWGNISIVSLSTSTGVEMDKSYSITVTTSTTANSITIRKNGNNLKVCFSTSSCSVSYTTPNSQSGFPLTIAATAVKYSGGLITGHDTKSKTVNLITDFVYKDGKSQLKSYTEGVIYNYASIAYSYDFYGNIDTTAEKIKAINHYARDIIADRWTSDEDAKTAKEVLNLFSDQNNKFDCRDMAAFVAGLAYSVGLSVQMISLHDDTSQEDYQHFFTIVNGLTVPDSNNQGWFLIDPARNVYGDHFDSYTDLSTITLGYGGMDGKGQIYKVSGWTQGEWGIGYGEGYTAWYSYSPDNTDVYDNPWISHQSVA